MNIHKQIFVETNFVHTHVCGCVMWGGCMPTCMPVYNSVFNTLRHWQLSRVAVLFHSPNSNAVLAGMKSVSFDFDLCLLVTNDVQWLFTFLSTIFLFGYFSLWNCKSFSHVK